MDPKSTLRKPWPADQVQRRPLVDLIPYARNARVHSDEQLAQIAASMREWGWTNPVLVDETGGIIAGHGRVSAARRLGWAEAPVMVATGWSEAQKRAYTLADNKLALNADWDGALLAIELGDLAAAGMDLGLAGFTAEELARLTATGTEGLTDPDDAPERPVEPVSRLGDVWVLGRHRLVCGDSTVRTDVDKALNGVAPHLMVTDPPYGVEYSAGWRNEAMPAKNDPSRWRDGAGRAVGAVRNDGRTDWRDAWLLFPGDVAYVWHAGRHASEVQTSLETAGLAIRCQIIWAKHQFVIGRGDYHWQHEPCWYAVRENATGHWTGDRKQTTLWEIAKPAKIRNRPQHSETGRVHEAPDREQLKPWTGGV